MVDDFRFSSDERTIPTRRGLNLRANDHQPGGDMLSDEGGRDPQNRDAPWALRQYLNGQTDLDAELSRRFPNMPVMSQFRLHQYADQRHGLAILATQDGAASLIVEVDEPTRAAQFTFVAGSMLGLKFSPARLSDKDRSYWLDTIQRAQAEQQGTIAFLWGASRWESDYLICAPRKHFTNVYAFSPLHVEAAARLTSEVMGKLVAWLDAFWRPGDSQPRAPKLTTW